MAATYIPLQDTRVLEATDKKIFEFTAIPSKRTTPKVKPSKRTTPKAIPSKRTTPKVKPSKRTTPKARTNVGKPRRAGRTVRKSTRGKQSVRSSPKGKQSVRSSPKGKQSVRSSPKAKSNFRPSHKVLTEQFRYSYKAFSRCNILLQRFPNLSGYYLKFINVRVYHGAGYQVDRNDFAMEKDMKERPIYVSSVTRSFEGGVNVCILQCGKDGSLTSRDKRILKCVRRNRIRETVLFVIVEELTDKQFVTVSEDIRDELGFEKSFNGVLHRLFPRQTDDITIRISLLFDKLLIAEIESAHKVDTAYAKKLNETDLQYHQLKNVSLRNGLICEFGLKYDKLFVAIKGIEKRKNVKDYLQKVLPFAHNNSIEIQPFLEVVHEDLYLKSGDAVGRPSDTYVGTVGLMLRDGTRHFCVTCKHVVERCLGERQHLVPGENMCNSLIITSEGTYFATDSILTCGTPEDLDFAAIRLVNEALPLSAGVRNQCNRFADGKLLGWDRFTIPHRTQVYKWGTISGLTNGYYIGRSEGRNKPPVFEIEGDGIKEFAVPGDSGSLVCYSEITGLEIAAFIVMKKIVRDNNTLIVGYKLADAVRSCTQILPNIKECIRIDEN